MQVPFETEREREREREWRERERVETDRERERERTSEDIITCKRGRMRKNAGKKRKTAILSGAVERQNRQAYYCAMLFTSVAKK